MEEDAGGGREFIVGGRARGAETVGGGRGFGAKPGGVPNTQGNGPVRRPASNNSGRFFSPPLPEIDARKVYSG
jgi:hypothetical protein